MAEELDEFGIPIKKKQSAVAVETDEFGIPMKKKTPLETAVTQSPISSTPSKSTYSLNEPFGASIVKKKEEPQPKKLPVVNTDDPKLTEGLKKAVSVYESINGKQPLLPASQDAIREMSPEEVATQKFRETPIGKTLTGLQYIGSKATKGAVNVVKGANGLLMDFASTQPSLMAPATVYNNKSGGVYDKVDKFTDLGLDPNQKHSMEDSHIMSNLGGAVEFGVPAYLGGELKAPQALVFGLQGLGSAKDETRKLREAGTPLDPTVEKAYEYGSAAIQAALFGELGSSIFGKMPLGLRKDVVSALSADLVKQGVEKNLTGVEFNNLLKQGISSLKDKSAQALYKIAETGTHATKTLLTLNTANFALKKGVDELNSKPVFKQTAEDFVEGTKNALISGVIFGTVGGLGAMSKLSKYSSYKNEVVETLMKDPSTENLMKVKNQIAEHGANEGWTEQEVNDTNAQVDKIGEITSKLKATEEAVGKSIPKNKLVDAVDLVNGRTELQEQLKVVQEGKKFVDESVKSEPNKNEQYLVDKIDQANDVLSDLITGKKTKYEHDAELDKYYKVRGEEKTEIDKSRYELEQKEAPYRDEKTYSIDDAEIKPVETPKAKDEVVEPTEEVKVRETIKPIEDEQQLPSSSPQGNDKGSVEPAKNEDVPIEVEDAETAQVQTDKILAKAEDDLKALKQVENKTAKYDGSIKRLTEAKKQNLLSEKEFNDLKNRFDDVIADSKPKADAKVQDVKLEPPVDKEPTAKKYEKDKEVEFTPRNGEKIKFKLSDVKVQDRPSDTKENSNGEVESRMDVMANGVKIGDAEITDLGNDIRADYLEIDRGNKGKGIGTVAYLSMAEHAKSLGKRLVSATANNRNEDSNAMLKRLEQQGIAKREGSGKGMYYVIDGRSIDASKDFAIKEIKKGAINWDGDMFTPRPELGLEWKDIRKGKQDLLDGKDTPASKRLVDAINKAKDDGGYNFVQGAGKANVKLFVPIDGKIPTNELSKEELNEITSKEAELASEYDRYFDSLTPEEKTEELNSIENGRETETNTSREGKTDVSDKEDTKAGDPIRKFADKLRQGKISKLGGFKTSTGFDGAWDLGLEAVASSLDAGAKIVDAIESGLKAIKNTEWYKNLENKDEFDTAFKNHLESEHSALDIKEDKGSTADFDKLAHKNIDSQEIRDTLSNKPRETGREFTQEEKEYNAQSRFEAIRHGDEVVRSAKAEFGDSYPVDLLNYVKDSNTLTNDKKSLILISLENDLERRLLETPDDLTLKKQVKLVTDYVVKFQRQSAISTGYGIIRQLARNGYDINAITNEFFTSKQQEAKSKINKAVQSTSSDVQTEYESEFKENTDVEKLVSEGVEKKIDEIYKSLSSKRRERADKAIQALDRIQKKLRSKTYDASIGVPVAIIDAGITTIKSAIRAGVNILDAVELGIKHIKEKYGKDWEKEDDFRKDMLSGFRDEKIATSETTDKFKQALIDAGFSKEINVRSIDENGERIKTKREVLDWTKLTGEEGSFDNIDKAIDDNLGKNGYSDREISEIKQSLKDEYNDLHARIIERAERELENRNEERTQAEIKSSAKRLAELYNYGLFDKESDTYDKLVNSAVGLSKIGTDAFAKAKKLAKSLAELYAKRGVDGNVMPEITFKKAVSDINSQIEELLTKVANKDSNWKYKAVDAVGEFMGLSQRNQLVSATQMIENTGSGYIERMFMDIGYRISNNVDTSPLRKKRGEIARAQMSDIIYNAGNDFGNVSSPFLVKSRVMDKISKLSENQLYHGATSVLLGRAFLEGADSMHKIALTEKYFTYNLVKILRKKGMPKSEAVKFVSENLTGQKFEEAKVQAKSLTEQINKDAGEELLSTKPDAITLLANDLVKNNLLVGNKMNTKELEASYKAAYKTSGFGLGHEANNVLSEQIALYNKKVQSELKTAVKERDWGSAVNIKMKSILMNNVMNPFVGGGTNWIFLATEKAGINPLAWVRAIRSVKDIDLSSESGMKTLSKDLYEASKRRNSAIRTLVGASIALSVYGASKTTDRDEEFAHWLKKNKWAQRYFDKIAPMSAMAIIAEENDDLRTFFRGSLNVKDRDIFSDGLKINEIAKYAIKPSEDQKQKSLGALGDLIGGKVNTPIIPWRVWRDEENIKRGLNGLEPMKVDFKTNGFWNGFFKGGFLDHLGLRPNGSSSKPMTEKEIQKAIDEALRKMK